MFREFLRKMRHETRNKRKIPFQHQTVQKFSCATPPALPRLFTAAIFSRQKARFPFQINAATRKFPATAAGAAEGYNSFKQNKLVRVFYYERFLFHLWRFCLCPSFNQEDNKGKLPVFENSLSLRTYQGTQSKSWSKLITFCNFTRLHGIARDIIKLSLVPDFAF